MIEMGAKKFLEIQNFSKFLKKSPSKSRGRFKPLEKVKR
jgi:hypothetical protein